MDHCSNVTSFGFEVLSSSVSPCPKTNLSSCLIHPRKNDSISLVVPLTTFCLVRPSPFHCLDWWFFIAWDWWFFIVWDVASVDASSLFPDSNQSPVHVVTESLWSLFQVPAKVAAHGVWRVIMNHQPLEPSFLGTFLARSSCMVH